VALFVHFELRVITTFVVKPSLADFALEAAVMTTNYEMRDGETDECDAKPDRE
jgi:hypothetical protein